MWLLGLPRSYMYDGRLKFIIITICHCGFSFDRVFPLPIVLLSAPAHNCLELRLTPLKALDNVEHQWGEPSQTPHKYLVNRWEFVNVSCIVGVSLFGCVSSYLSHDHFGIATITYS